MSNSYQQPQSQVQIDNTSIPASIVFSSTITLAVAGFAAKWAFGQLVSYWQKQIEDLRAEIKVLTVDQVIVKTEYVSKEEFLRVTTRFEAHMDRLVMKIDRLLEK
jgi:hypothetical protein